MKVVIGDSLRHEIASVFAGWVHASVITMHLRASWGIHPCEKGKAFEEMPHQKAKLQEMRRFVRSIKDPFERRIFCMTVGVLFKHLRASYDTHPKWQDYVASVRKNVASTKEAA